MSNAPEMDREYDIVLYGASGFTSGFVIRELEMSPLRIAVAARSVSRIPNTKLPKIECPIEEIGRVTARTKVLINCVGPYVLHGEMIIKSCIRTGTHYVDICGEPSFLESMHRKYNKEAESKSLRIIQCCGLDSLPADIGLYMLGKNHDMLEVEVILSVSNFRIHRTTWESLILSLESFQKLPKASTLGNNSAMPSMRVQEHKFMPELNSYAVRFRGTDPYVIRRSSAFFRMKGITDVRACCYLEVGGIANLVMYYIAALFIYAMSRHRWTAGLLRKYPGVFTLGIVTDRPSEDNIRNSSFQMLFRAVHPETQRKYHLRICGPNPGYVSTAIFVTQSAFTLVEEEDKVLCGVLTPAVALHKTRIAERLSLKGITIDQY